MGRMVEFGDLVKEENRIIEVVDDVEYSCAGVRLHGKGIFIRERKYGYEIKKKFVQHTIKPGDIVYSTLFAKHGAFAIADECFEGAILSEKFPTFLLQNDDVSRDYLRWFFRSGQLNRIAEDQMTGIAAFSLAHLGKSKFLKLKVPVPSPARQAEVVRLCEEASSNVERSITPIKNNVDLLEHLIGVTAEKLFAGLPCVLMRDYGDYVLRGIRVEAGKQYSQVTVAMNHRGLRLRRICDGSEIRSSGQCVVEEGDLLFSRIDIRQGAIGFVGKDLAGGVVTRDFPVFRLNNTSPNSRQFMRYVLMTPSFMSQAREASRGTTGRMKMKRPAFLDFRVPWVEGDSLAAVVKVLTEFESNLRKAITAYKGQEILAKGLGTCVVQKLYAQDSGLMM